MKAKLKAYRLLSVCIIMVIGLGVSSCSNDDAGKSGNIELLSFGPSPIPRGDTLRIVGTNLDKVESVILPGAGAITDIERISKSEIRLIIPQSASNGVITLKSGNTEVTSLTPLTIDETVVIRAISPLTAKAGDVIKIEGNYLDFIEAVVFPTDIMVMKAGFISQSRAAIEVKIPAAAQSGKIGVFYDPDTTQTPYAYKSVYSEMEVGVTLPTITSFSPATIRAGGQLTITGTDLNLVKSITFGGNKVASSFTVNPANTTIIVTVPADAQDGPVVLNTVSGVAVSSATQLVMKMPTITSISPNPVKNGAVLTVTGTDLDLINKVTFGGSKVGTIAAGGSATQIQVNVPIDAVTGAVVFTTQANKTVSSPALNLIVPVITNIAPTSIFAGDKITITGTDLDLVNQVILGNNTTGVIVSQSATSIVVQTLPNTTTGIVSLKTANGTTVNSTQSITINSILPIITSITPQVKPGALLSIAGTKLNLVESITFQTGIKATKYGTRSETLIEVYVPDNAKTGNVTLTMTTFDGKDVISPPFVVAGTDPVVDPKLIIYDFDNIGADQWDGVGEIVSGDGPSGKFYEVTAAHPAAGGWHWLFAENWRTHPTVSGISNYVLKIDIRLRNDITIPAGSWGVQVQANISGKIFDILSYVKVGNVFTTGSEWKTISIPLSSISGFPDPTSASGGNWGMNTNQGSPNVTGNYVGLCIDNIRYEKVN